MSFWRALLLEDKELKLCPVCFVYGKFNSKIQAVPQRLNLPAVWTSWSPSLVNFLFRELSVKFSCLVMRSMKRFFFGLLEIIAESSADVKHFHYLIWIFQHPTWLCSKPHSSDALVTKYIVLCICPRTERGTFKLFWEHVEGNRSLAFTSRS